MGVQYSMSSITSRLGLVAPSLNDEVHQTIQDLSNNFVKLDDASEIYLNHPPQSGEWPRGKHIWNNSPSVDSYAGWVNIRSGRAAPEWSQLYAYRVGDLVVSNQDNGHVYECTQAGQSGTIEPLFPTGEGQSVVDTRGGTVWQASRSYQLHDIAFPSMDNNRFYVCTVAGSSGVSEPTWSLLDGGTVDDHTVVWTGYRIATWREVGVSALFRPFGLIR